MTMAAVTSRGLKKICLRAPARMAQCGMGSQRGCTAWWRRCKLDFVDARSDCQDVRYTRAFQTGCSASGAWHAREGREAAKGTHVVVELRRCHGLARCAALGPAKVRGARAVGAAKVDAGDGDPVRVTDEAAPKVVVDGERARLWLEHLAQRGHLQHVVNAVEVICRRVGVFWALV